MFLLGAAAIACAVLVAPQGLRGGTAAACANSEAELEGEAGELEGESGEVESEEAVEAEAEREGDAAGSEVGEFFSGPEHEVPCAQGPHPESFRDLALANSSRMARNLAPGTQIKPGAYRAAVKQRRALEVTGGPWQTYGKPPLISNRTEFDETGGVTREGLGDLSGRVNGFARDDSGTTYAGVSGGGVWKSTDLQNWTSIGDGLPTQVVGGIAWTPAGGGTLIVLTGDRAFAGPTIGGLGVYRSTDGGQSWQHSEGVPDGVLGFRLAVDPNDPAKVYAATGAGLYRSTDAGATWVNVNLPTGENAPPGTPDCTGQPPSAKDCFLANMVTDVVVQGPDNTQTPDTDAKPGAVMAAVGWRAGTKENEDGAQQSPGNGIYVSDTGAPGTFQNMDMAANSVPTTDPLTQARIGRVALGIASGADQNHRIVYALVQDAVEFNGGALGLDAAETGTLNPAYSDYLNGVWVSTDFGQSWRQLEGSSTIDNDTTSGSALAPPVCKAPAVISYCPGIQAWYNLWISPDPTQASATGVPTRVGFGLEEVWGSDSATVGPTGLDGSTPHKFKVIGRYYAGEVCTLLIATNGLPVCPAAPGGVKPPYTTHPDQHASLWVPDGGGGVTLVVGNDGGIYKQHVDAGDELSNDGWGQGKRQDADGNEVSGANDGLSTLQPYDAAMSSDGTLYMGLQDNGEVKIDPDGTTYSVFGGDGFYTAVHPTDSKIAYEEYTYGVMSVTTDGGVTWADITPANLTSSLFGTPFEMDPEDPDHLMIGGRDVEETTSGPDTTSSSWKTVYDLGTQQHPGDADAVAADDDPDNQLSAVDLRSGSKPAGLPTGPKTADQRFQERGGDTLPGHDQTAPLTGQATQVPGTYNDYPVTIGPNDGDAAMRVSVTWADSAEDWDLYLYREEDDGSLTYVDSSANGGTTFERLRQIDPEPGDYVVRVVNWEALGTYDLAITFTQRTAAAQQTSAAYVGYCGYCDTITQGTPFANGIATNVGGDKPGTPGSSDGWHIAAAEGLPERYITSIRIDPSDPGTVYVTLAGYGRRWAAPGAVGDDTSKVGTGHVFVSTDAGEHFSDISTNLPDVPANWSVLHRGRLVVGTDVGVFVSCNAMGGTYSVLGTGLPNVPISTLRFKAGDPDLLVAATFGRGIYTYQFDDAEPLVCHGAAADGGDNLQPFGEGAVIVKIAKKVKRKRKQRVRVKLISTVGSALEGTLRLKTKPQKRHGKVAVRPKPRKVRLKPAGRVKLRMRLTRASRKALKQGRKIKATAVVKLSDANGRKVSLKKSRRVKRAKVRH